MASGGHGTGQGPGEKNRSKILKSAIFELHKCNTPQKKAEKNRHLDLKKNRGFYYEKIEKKIDFVIFDPKKS